MTWRLGDAWERAADRRADWLRERSFTPVGPERLGGRSSVLNVVTFPLRRIWGGTALQMLARLDAEAEQRATAVMLPAPDGVWRLEEVTRTSFDGAGPRTERFAETEWHSAVNPDLLDALIVKPERMSAWALHRYTEHLAGNRQRTERYEIALWKKLLYPLATIVMMALALPFAYMQARAGMVGVKVFLGIMLGIFFHMLNSLFSHIGLLQNWPPFAAAALPSAAFFLAAVTAMWWVERR